LGQQRARPVSWITYYMIIGILQCDSVRSEFRQQFENYPEMFQSLLKKIDPSLSFRVYDVQHGHYPNSLNECNAYITTGSKASVYDGNAWIDVLEKFLIEINDHNIKLVAICFGHQLIAQAFGGSTEKSSNGWGVGVHTNKIHTKPAWMDPALQQINLLVSHQDQVIRLPEKAQLIAGSEFCPNGMFQLGNNILTIQGHPEFNAKYAETLMRFREKLIGKDQLEAGIKSLQQQTDEITIARWMIHFFSCK